MKRYDLDLEQLIRMLDAQHVAQHFESPSQKYLRHLNIINESITELSIVLQEDPDKHRPSELRHDLITTIETLGKIQLEIECLVNELEHE